MGDYTLKKDMGFALMKGVKERGVPRRLPGEEMRDHQGPAHYIQHQKVFEPVSVATLVRIMFYLLVAVSFLVHADSHRCGLLTPFMQDKLVMSRLLAHSPSETAQWDGPVPDDCRNECLSFFIGIFKLEVGHFPRCTKPFEAFGDPVLVIFSDASTWVYGTSAYIRWQPKPNEWEAFLVTMTSKKTPNHRLRIPRLEHCTAVTEFCLGETVQDQMTYFSEIIQVDSLSVRPQRFQIKRESYGLGTFIVTRVNEIREKYDPGQWWWMGDRNNQAKVLNRPSKPDSLTTISL